MNNKRKIQEINAGSMADIAFLLLIFFLVATTMNVDSGINRVLPPLADENFDEKPPEIKERNLLNVRINQFDAISVQGRQVHIMQIKDIAKDFVLNRSGDENLPEKETTQIDLLGSYPVSKGIISLQNDRGTSYETYIMVQNELTRAFNEIRDEVSRERFGRTFAELDSNDQREAIQKAVPLKISEAEPRNIGGN